MCSLWLCFCCYLQNCLDYSRVWLCFLSLSGTRCCDEDEIWRCTAQLTAACQILRSLMQRCDRVGTKNYIFEIWEYKCHIKELIHCTSYEMFACLRVIPWLFGVFSLVTAFPPSSLPLSFSSQPAFFLVPSFLTVHFLFQPLAISVFVLPISLPSLYSDYRFCTYVIYLVK